jgi:creatinine amidohydrolase/Fe(II)-dependent formamide hydrolase-like protein
VLPAAAEQGVVMADHAGFYETSLLLASRPELVELERLGMDAPWYCTASDSRARLASVEAGERMWQATVDAWVEKLLSMQRPSRPTPDQVTVEGLF